MSGKVIGQFQCGCESPDCKVKMSVVDIPSDPHLVRLELSGPHANESFLLTKTDMPAFVNALKEGLDIADGGG